MSEARYYRFERRPPRRRGGRRVLVPVLVALLVAVAVAVALAGPWFGHFGLPWPGGAAASEPTVRIVGAEGWHDGPVDVRFVAVAGTSAATQWRLDGGPWQSAAEASIPAPRDHSNDGTHTVDARTVGDDRFSSATVRIDTTPPKVAKVAVSPRLIRGSQTLLFKFDVPAGQEGQVAVSWRVVDTLGEQVGEDGPPQPASGATTVEWRAATRSGRALMPGTYRLQVTARDAAGNESLADASFGSQRPVKARLITRLPKAGKLVALTFDGGSGYAWRHIMKELTKLDAKGTFFCTGVSVERYPEVAREAVAQGMTLGNHSFDHPDFRSIGYEEARSQLRRNAEAWWKACGALPNPFFRPPYGSHSETTLKAAGAAGYPFVVNWDVDTGDWTGVSPREIARRAVSGARPGSIILMHTQWNSEKAVPAIVKGLRAKGLEPVGLDALLRAAGRAALSPAAGLAVRRGRSRAPP